MEQRVKVRCHGCGKTFFAYRGGKNVRETCDKQNLNTGCHWEHTEQESQRRKTMVDNYRKRANLLKVSDNTLR